MRIIYHHRTRSTDAQRIHIQEIVKAFETLGHEVEMVSLVPIDAGQNDAQRDAGDAWWKKLVRRIPFSYDLVQLGYNVIGLPMILAACVRRRADFIYERYSLLNFAGVLAARICRIPIILEVNSPFALEQTRDGEIQLRGFANWSERVICNLASHVIVVSTPLRRILAQNGVEARKIEVMTNGVCLESFRSQPASQELKRKLGLQDSTVIGFVGWFRKWHGLELLLDAFRRENLVSEKVKVLMIGDGPAMPGLQEFVQANCLTESVIFTGPLPHAEVPAHLHLIDIAVQPAANEYCCPMKLLEYMALGKAIVAPRQENIEEVVREGREAAFFTPESVESLGGALRALVQNRALQEELGRRARAAIDERGFLWAEIARKVVLMVDAAPSEEAMSKKGAVST
jgi:glycosyltransferase involved in cell wall biosynthesis